MKRQHAGRGFCALAAAVVLATGLAVSAGANVTTFLAGALNVQPRRVILDPDSITVRFREAVSRAGIDGAAAQEGCRVLSHARFTPGLCTLAIPPTKTVPAMVAAFARRTDVLYAEPTYLDYPLMVPNDPLYSQQWHFPMIHMEEAWDIEPGGSPSTIVCVLDTGVAYENYTDGGGTYIVAPDLDGLNFVDPQDILDGDAHPNDIDAHGTHVCGTIAQQTNNSLGVAGIAYNISVMPVRSVPGTHQNFSDGVHWAVDHGAKIINYSAGGSDSQTKHDAVLYAAQNDVLIIAAMGNDSERNPVAGFPGRYPECLGVGALNRNKGLAFYSNWGSDVDVTAPGGEQPPDPDGVLQNTFDTTPTNMGYFFYQGTSMATPHVTGLAALLWSQGSFANTMTDLRDAIQSTCEDLGTPGWDETFGWGLIDAEAAVMLGATDQPPRPPTTVNAFDTANDEGGSTTITWRKSPDDGGGRDDVVGYRVYRGTQPDPTSQVFQLVADESVLPKKSSGYVDNDPALVDGTSYYYFVRAVDASGVSANSNVGGPAVPRDDASPPAIDTLVAQDTQADNGRSITLSWVGYVSPPDLVEFRIYRSEALFSAITEDGVDLIGQVTNPSARSYVDRATDPADPTAPPLDQTDYFYAVTAVDEVPNEVKTVQAAGPAQCAPNLSMSYGLGLRMITLPANPIDPDPAAVFGFGDGEDVLFARYDPLGGAYRAHETNPSDPFLQVAPGRSFWLDRDLPSFIAVGGHVVTDAESEVSLESGWNQVGSPYDADYLFEGILVRDQLGTDEHITASNLVRKYGWRFDPFQLSYRLLSPILPNAETTLPAREGMWIYAFQPGLKLVFENNVAAAAAPTEKPAKLDGWQIRLIARTAWSTDGDNTIGVSSRAAEIGTIVGPPPVGQGVDLYFGPNRAAVDLRKARPAKWDATVECRAADTDVELTWPDLAALPADVRPVLTDLATKRSVYMRTATAYRYHSVAEGEERQFRITFAGPAAGPVLGLFTATPARGGVELSYALNRAADVTVEVLNLAGRRVATVGGASGDVGLNRVLWNGVSSTGQAVPGGRYVVKITAVARDNGETVSAIRALALQR